jgi:hypothetical protein
MENNYGVPFCRLYQNRYTETGGPDKVIIGDTSLKFEETNYGKSGVVGLNDVSIKYGMGFISCNISFPIMPEVLIDAQANQDNEMNKIFAMINTWDIEFGWGGNEPNKLSGMKMSRWKLAYAADKKLFMTSFTLVPANGYVLGDIKILMLKDTVNELKKIFHPDGGKARQTTSLGYVISLLLNASRNFVKENGNNIKLSE